jgi:hypothetical protein
MAGSPFEHICQHSGAELSIKDKTHLLMLDSDTSWTQHPEYSVDTVPTMMRLGDRMDKER